MPRTRKRKAISRQQRDKSDGEIVLPVKQQKSGEKKARQASKPKQKTPSAKTARKNEAKKKPKTLKDKCSVILDELFLDLELVSLARLKKELKSRFGFDPKLTRNKTSLKKAMKKLSDAGSITSVGASFKRAPGSDEEDEDEDEDESGSEESSGAAEAPEPTFRGLYKMKEEKAKSARSICKGCGRNIAKGATRWRVGDDSLWWAVGGHLGSHEGASRGDWCMY
jgi:hypothetical protein